MRHPILLAALLWTSLASCEDARAAEPGAARLELLLVDGPAAGADGRVHTLSARLAAPRLELVSAAGRAPVSTELGGPGRAGLALELRTGGQPVELAALELPAGRWIGLRLHLDAARCLPSDGPDHAGEGVPPFELPAVLELPLPEPVALAPGEQRTLRIDLGLARAAASGSPEPLPAVSDPAHTARLAGVLVAGSQRLAGGLVLALPPGERRPERALAITVANTEGRFELDPLPPGDCDLRALDGERVGELFGLALEAGGTLNVAVELR